MHELNGTNGAPRKVFSLTPALDERTIAILAVRKKIQAWPRRTKSRDGLTPSEKNFFVWLLDLSLDPKENDRSGVIVISDTAAARENHVCTKTIFLWRWNLVRITGQIWISKQFRPNMTPAVRYHITVLDPAPTEQQHYTRDGVYGGKKLRGEMSGGQGARKPGQKSLPLPGSKSVNGYSLTEGGLWTPEYSQVPEITADNRNPLRLTPEADYGSQPKPITALSRNGLRLTAEMGYGSQPKPVTAPSRNGVPVSAVTDASLNKSLEREIETLERRGEGHPPPDALQVWVRSLEGMFPSRLEKLKVELLGKIRMAQSEDAKANWRWRLARVNERLVGPAVKDKPQPKPKTIAIVQKPPTKEELLEGARYLISTNKLDLLKPEQIEALKELAPNELPQQLTEQNHAATT